MSASKPYYPGRGVSYGNIYFYLKARTFNINPFDKQALHDAKSIMLKEAREASPSYKLFIASATKATGLSERTIKKYIYTKEA